MKIPEASDLVTVLAVVLMVTSMITPAAAGSGTVSSTEDKSQSEEFDFNGLNKALSTNLDSNDIEQIQPAIIEGAGSKASLQYPTAGPELENINVKLGKVSGSNQNGSVNIKAVINGTYKKGTYPWKIPVTVTAKSSQIETSEVVSVAPSNGTNDYRGAATFNFRYVQDTDTTHQITVEAASQLSSQSTSKTVSVLVKGTSTQSLVETTGQVQNSEVSEKPKSVSRISRYKTSGRADEYLEDPSLPVGEESIVNNFPNAKKLNNEAAEFKSFRGDMDIGTLISSIPNGSAQTLVIRYKALSGDDIRLSPVDGNGRLIENRYTLPSNPADSEYCHSGTLADLCVFRLSDFEVSTMGDLNELIVNYETETDATVSVYCQDVVTGAMPEDENTVCGAGSVGDFSDGQITGVVARGGGESATESETLRLPSNSDIRFDVTLENAGSIPVSDTITIQSKDGTHGPVTKSVSLGGLETKTVTVTGFPISVKSHTFVITFDGSRKEIRVVPESRADKIPPTADGGGPYRVPLDSLFRETVQSGLQQQTLSEDPGSGWSKVQNNAGTSREDTWEVQATKIPVITSIQELDADSTNNVEQMNDHLRDVHGPGVTVNDVYREEIDFTKDLLPPATNRADWELKEIDFTTKVRTDTLIDTERPPGYGWSIIDNERLIPTGEFEYKKFRTRATEDETGLTTRKDVEGERWVVDYSKSSNRELVGYEYINDSVDPDEYENDSVDDWQQDQFIGTERVLDDFQEWEPRYQETRYQPGPGWEYLGREGDLFEYRKTSYTTKDIYTWKKPVYNEYYTYKRATQEMANEYQREVYNAIFTYERDLSRTQTLSLWEGPQYEYQVQYETESLTLDGSASYDEGPPSHKGIDRYNWLFQDETKSTGITTTKDYTTPFGIYEPELTVFDNVGNKDSKNFSVLVMPASECIGPFCDNPTQLRPSITINEYSETVSRSTELVYINFNITGALDRKWNINVTAPDAQQSFEQNVWSASEIVNGEEQVEVHIDPSENNIPTGEIEFVLTATSADEKYGPITKSVTVTIYSDDITDCETPAGQRDADKDGIINCEDPCPYIYAGENPEECGTGPTSGTVAVAEWNSSSDWARGDSEHIRYTTFKESAVKNIIDGPPQSKLPTDKIWIGYPAESQPDSLLTYYPFDGEVGKATPGYSPQKWQVTDWAGNNNAAAFNAEAERIVREGRVTDTDYINDFARNDTTAPLYTIGGVFQEPDETNGIYLWNRFQYLEIVSPTTVTPEGRYVRPGPALANEFNNDGISVSFWTQKAGKFENNEGVGIAGFKANRVFSFEDSSGITDNRRLATFEYAKPKDNPNCLGIFTDCPRTPTWLAEEKLNPLDSAAEFGANEVSGDFDAGNWVHIAYVMDDNGIKIYQNGELTFAPNRPEYEYDGNPYVAPLTDGGYQTEQSVDGTRFLWGAGWNKALDANRGDLTRHLGFISFDEIRIYNKALNGIEVRKEAYIDNKGSIRLASKSVNQSVMSENGTLGVKIETPETVDTLKGDVEVTVESGDGSISEFVEFSSSDELKELDQTRWENVEEIKLFVVLTTDKRTETPTVSSVSVVKEVEKMAEEVTFEPQVVLNAEPNPSNADEETKLLSAVSDPDSSVSTYTVDWDDGASQTESIGAGGVPTLTHAYECAGEYDATFTVTDETGISNSYTERISVTNELPSVNIVQSAVSIDPGETVSFTADGDDPDGSIESYSWQFHDGMSAEGADVSKTFSSPGTYNVVLTATDNACEDETAVSQVTVESNPPTADAGSDQSLNPGIPMQFDGTGSSDPDGDALTYEWDVDGDGDYEKTGATPTTIYNTEGVRVVELRVTDPYGNSDTDTMSVTVNPPFESYTWIDADFDGGNDGFSFYRHAGRGTHTYNSYRYSAYTRWDGGSRIISPSVDTENARDLTLSYWVRRGDDRFSEDTDGGENFRVQYRDNGGSWNTLKTYQGGGRNGQSYTNSINLPSDAYHSNLKIRFRQTDGSSSNYDYWHVDDVVLNGERGFAGSGFEIQSCSDLPSSAESGEYQMRHGGTTHTVYCEMNPDTSRGNSRGSSGGPVESQYTFKFVESGITTNQVSDNDSCKEMGLVLFQPRGPDEYDVGRNYVINDYGYAASNWGERPRYDEGGGLGPMGVHISINGESDGGSGVNFDAEEHRDLASPEYVGRSDSLGADNLYGKNTDGWRTMISERFWVAEDQDETEPNGDYQANTWLGWQDYDNDGYVTNHNDLEDADYGYNQYLCWSAP